MYRVKYATRSVGNFLKANTLFETLNYYKHNILAELKRIIHENTCKIVVFFKYKLLCTHQIKYRIVVKKRNHPPPLHPHTQMCCEYGLKGLTD